MVEKRLTGKSRPVTATFMRRSIAGIAALSLALLSCLCQPAAAASDDKSHGADSLGHLLDVFNPYASLTLTNDSNIYRLDDQQPSIGDRGDQFTTLAVGFDSNIKSGLQQYLLSGEYSPTRYNNHTDINYDGAKAAAIWHWTATDLLAGTAGYRYSQSLRNFANQLAPKRIIDLRTENHFFAGADYDLPENWKVGARGDFADVNFNHTSGLDIQRTSGGANLDYISRAGNTLGFDAQYTHGNYKNSPVEDFNEYTIGPTVEWKFTVRTQLKGNLGYTERSYTNNSRKPAYGNVTGRFTLTIADAGRGSLSAAMWRELSNLGDEIAEYTIINGLSLDPAWTLSNGLTARVHGSYEHRDFKVVSGVEGDRIDDVGNISGFLDWPIGRHFKLSGGVTVERRSSTRYLQSYSDLQQQLQIVGTL